MCKHRILPQQIIQQKYFRFLIFQLNNHSGHVFFSYMTKCWVSESVAFKISTLKSVFNFFLSSTPLCKSVCVHLRSQLHHRSCLCGSCWTSYSHFSLVTSHGGKTGMEEAARGWVFCSRTVPNMLPGPGSEPLIVRFIVGCLPSAVPSLSTYTDHNLKGHYYAFL